MVLSFPFSTSQICPGILGLSSFPLFLPCGCFLHHSLAKAKGGTSLMSVLVGTDCRIRGPHSEWLSPKIGNPEAWSCYRRGKLAGRSGDRNCRFEGFTGWRVTLLRQDLNKIRAAVFASHCASCHRYNGHDAVGFRLMSHNPPPTLPVLPVRNGSLNYLIMTYVSENIGGTKFKDGTMARKALAKYTDEEKNCSQTSQDFWLTSDLPYEES